MGTGRGSITNSAIRGTHLALASINRSLRKTAGVSVFVPEYVIKVADRAHSEYEESISSAPDIEELRKWIRFYGANLRFVKQDFMSQPLVDLAETCASTEKPYDSGTMEK
jgi:hypothetical protein